MGKRHQGAIVSGFVMLIATPLVYFFYNRYDTAVAQMEAIKSLRFSRVYIFLDGPKNDNDKIVQKKIRDLIYQNICTDELLFFQSDINLGCKRSVSRGITQVFDQEDQAIFLEDDCIPTLGTFTYFETALKMYSQHKHIKMVSGSNLLAHTQNNADISLSETINCWGWAGWKHKTTAICNFDIYIDDIKPMLANSKTFGRLSYLKQCYWRLIFFNSIKSNTVWDFYLQLNLFHHNGCSLVPKRNLITNIGFSESATHTKFNDTPGYVRQNYVVNIDEVKDWAYPKKPTVSRQREDTILPVLYEYSTLRVVKLFIGTFVRIFHGLFGLIK
jgi:hypothetical protein